MLCFSKVEWLYLITLNSGPRIGVEFKEQMLSCMEDMEVYWFCHGHTEMNGKRGHMLKPSRVACEAALWLKLKDLDSHIYFLSAVPFTISMFLQLITRSTIPFKQTTSSSFPSWSWCKVEMPNLWHCNHLHSNRLWNHKNKIMTTSLQDPAKGETRFYAGEALFQTQIALMTAGENTENYCWCRKRFPNLSYKCFY